MLIPPCKVDDSAWPTTSSDTPDVLHSQLGVALTQLQSPQCSSQPSLPLKVTTSSLQAVLPFLPLFQAPLWDQ